MGATTRNARSLTRRQRRSTSGTITRTFIAGVAGASGRIAHLIQEEAMTFPGNDGKRFLLAKDLETNRPIEGKRALEVADEQLDDQLFRAVDVTGHRSRPDLSTASRWLTRRTCPGRVRNSVGRACPSSATQKTSR